MSVEIAKCIACAKPIILPQKFDIVVYQIRQNKVIAHYHRLCNPTADHSKD